MAEIGPKFHYTDEQWERVCAESPPNHVQMFDRMSWREAHEANANYFIFPPSNKMAKLHLGSIDIRNQLLSEREITQAFLEMMRERPIDGVAEHLIASHEEGPDLIEFVRNIEIVLEEIEFNIQAQNDLIQSRGERGITQRPDLDIFCDRALQLFAEAGGNIPMKMANRKNLGPAQRFLKALLDPFSSRNRSIKIILTDGTANKLATLIANAVAGKSGIPWLRYWL